MSLSSRRSALASDLASIGLLAPVRAAYEISRRAGLHRAVFSALSRKDPLAHTLDVSVTSVAGTDHRAAQRALAEAGIIASGKVRLFSREINIGADPDWHAVIHRGGSWPAAPWWEIDLRSPDRPGDVKWAWELGRHRHLVVLARAAALEPQQRTWIDTIERHLGSFLAMNPHETGVHWCSSLELALRSLSWLEVLALIGDRLEPSLKASMASHLWHAGAHILAELPYSMSSMRNNHLLGEAAGLVSIGGALHQRTWARTGAQLFDWQLRNEMSADGSTIEESLSYQRFVMDIVVRRLLAGGTEADLAASRAALRHAAAFLGRIGAYEGCPPQFGDWDEGRALASGGDPFDFRGIAGLGAVLGGSAAAADDTGLDEIAWYAPHRSLMPVAGGQTRPLSPGPGPSRGTSTLAAAGGGGGGGIARATAAGGGIARATAGDMAAWLRAGHTRWHAHSDIGSVSVKVMDDWVIGDPGTGSYNADDDQRRALRSSHAHAVIEIDDLEQVLPHRSFRWSRDPWCAIGAPIHDGETAIIWAASACYPQPLVRAVAVEAGSVTIFDWVLGAAGTTFGFTSRFPLGPTAQLREDLSIDLPRATGLRLIAPECERVEIVPSAWSHTYGESAGTEAILARGRTGSSVMITTIARAGPSVWHPETVAARRGDRTLAASCRGTVIALRLDRPEGSILRELRMAHPRQAGEPSAPPP